MIQPAIHIYSECLTISKRREKLLQQFVILTKYLTIVKNKLARLTYESLECQHPRKLVVTEVIPSLDSKI